MERSVINVMELVCKGSPKKVHAGPGDCFKIAPLSTKVSAMKSRERGVMRLFSSVEKSVDHQLLHQDPRVVKLLSDHMESSLQIAHELAMGKIKSMMKEEFENWVSAEDREVLLQLKQSRTIRCLLDQWLEVRAGKEAMRVLNQAAESGNVIREIKTSLKHKNHERIQAIVNFIDGYDGFPSGQGFVDILEGYLEANKLIHKPLSIEEIQELKKRIEEGESFGLGNVSQTWLSRIVADLLGSGSRST